MYKHKTAKRLFDVAKRPSKRSALVYNIYKLTTKNKESDFITDGVFNLKDAPRALEQNRKSTCRKEAIIEVGLLSEGYNCKN